MTVTNDTDDFDDGFGKVGAILCPYAYFPVWQEVSPVHAEIAVDAAGEDCGAKDVAMGKLSKDGFGGELPTPFHMTWSR